MRIEKGAEGKILITVRKGARNANAARVFSFGSEGSGIVKSSFA